MIKVVIVSLFVSLGVLTPFVANNAFAADERGRYWTYGVGKKTCKDYRQARLQKEISDAVYKSWISGYITSSNRLTDDTYNLLGDNGLQAALSWVDGYCEKHTENTLYMAVANMTAVFYSHRKKTK